MTPRWFILEAISRKLWPCLFFLTAHNFAKGPHFVALTQLRATKTGSNICCTHIHFLNPGCVRIPWVLAPKNFPIENFRVRSVSPKGSLFHQFLCPDEKKVSKWCALNFNATDLPHCPFEPSFYTTLPGAYWYLQFDIETVDKKRISTPRTSR